MTLQQQIARAFEVAVGFVVWEMFWYILAAAAAWLFFTIVFRAFFRHRRVAREDPTRQQIRREFLQSLRSIVIFGFVTFGLILAARQGWTRFYSRVDAHGWPWFWISIGLMIVLHDTYFYWTHRLMHHRRLFAFFHRTHHLSTSPTPWAAYAFSPAEAFVQAGIGPVIVFLIPVHAMAFATFMVWQITFNVLGHCSYEVMPRWFMRTPAGWLLNSVTHHTQHHEKFRANFGLYFNVWDRLMGTNHPEYETRFAQVVEKPQPAQEPISSLPVPNVEAGAAHEGVR